MTLCAFSHGGGVQSTACLVLAAAGRIPHRLHLFANVGDRAENPDTLAYIREHSVPFAAAHGIEFVEVRWVDRSGRERDLYDDLVEQRRSIGIPVRLEGGGFGTRQCTARRKIEVVARELRRRGATVEEPAVVGIGISTDELDRARTGVPKEQPWTVRSNPLLDLGLSRTAYARIVLDAGLPVPPKSSCSFCPFQGLEQWRRQRREHPDLWDRNVGLDAMLRHRHIELRGDPAGLASATLPLDQAVDDQLTLDGIDAACAPDASWFT